MNTLQPYDENDPNMAQLPLTRGPAGQMGPSPTVAPSGNGWMQALSGAMHGLGNTSQTPMGMQNPGAMQRPGLPRYSPYGSNPSMQNAQGLGKVLGGALGGMMHPGVTGGPGLGTTLPGGQPLSPIAGSPQMSAPNVGTYPAPAMAAGGIALGPQEPSQLLGTPGTTFTEPSSTMRRYSPVSPLAPKVSMSPKPEEMAHHLPTKLRIGQRINVKLPRPTSRGLGGISLGH